MDKSIIKEAIANIDSTSEALEKYCREPENYNSHRAELLERMSWELHKQANDLREIQYLYMS